MSSNAIPNFVKGFDDQSAKTTLKFIPKNKYSFKNNPICGATFYQFSNIVFKYISRIEVCYYPRFIFAAAISIFNSILGFIECVLYPDIMIESIELPNNPVFIIGHPRSGTTLLHNLLSLDQQNFYFCTTFCVGFPNCFLWFETIGKILFAGVIEKTRPMDSVKLHFDLPQEDECATNLLSLGRSYIMPLWFMNQEPDFRKYLDFSEADGGAPDDEMQWTRSFLFLLKKVTLREYKSRKDWMSGYSRENIKRFNNQINIDNHNNIKRHSSSANVSPSTAAKRLLLKSPIHAARVPLLKKIFPFAKFIYLHRNPYEVFQSQAHMVDTMYWFTYFNTPSREQIMNFILWQFENMWTKYSNAKAQYQRDIFELSYADLTADSQHNYAKILEIYKFLSIDYQNAQTQLYSSQASAMAEYTTNKHVALPADVLAMINERWQDYISQNKY